MRRFALAALSLAIFTPYAAQALWAEPSCDPSVDPTTCNISAPLNVSSVAQTKAGALTISGALTASSTATITGAFTANGAVTVNGTGSTFNSPAIFNTDVTTTSKFIYSGAAGNFTLTNDSINDSEVSNTLTSSIFIGTGSTSNAVDLNTAEVAGEKWVDTTGDTMTGALVMSTAALGSNAISITQPAAQYGLYISGASTQPAIALNPTGAAADGIEITLGNGTTGRNLDLYAAGTATGNIISLNSSSTTAGAYPINLTSSGSATRSINVTNSAASGYSVYGTSSGANSIGVAGVGLGYGVAGTTTTGYGIYGRASSSGYAGYFDSSTTAGTSVYVTLSSGATTNASKALEVVGKNGYGAYITANGNSSTALYVDNVNSTSGITKYGIQTQATTPAGVAIRAVSAYGFAGQFSATSGGTGISIDTDGGLAIDTDGGDINHPGSYLGGQFYPNENAGNGVTPNVLVDYVDTVSLASGYTTKGLAWDGTQLWASRKATFPTNGILENVNTVNSQLLDSADIGFSNAGPAIYAPGFGGTGDNVWIFSTTADNYFYIDRVTGSSTTSSAGFTGTTGYPQAGAYDGQNIWLGTTKAITEFGSTGVLFNRVSGTGNITDIIYADGSIWATDNTNDVVHKVNTSTYADTQITVGSDPSALVYDGEYIWVANYTDSTLTRISTEDNSTDGYSLSTMGTGPNDLVYDGANVWIAFENSGIGYWNVANGTPGESDALLGASADFLAFDGTNIWVGDDDSYSVLKVPTGTGFGGGDPAIRKGLLMYNSSGNLRCLYISGTTVTASSTLTECQ